MLIPAIAIVVGLLLVVGLPALAVVAFRFFKFKERELALEMEFRQKWQQQGLAIDQRVQRLEDGLTSLDREVHDVRVRLGIDQEATPLASRPDLLEGPATPDAQRRQSLDPSRTNAR